jgi:hypothetical protein
MVFLTRKYRLCKCLWPSFAKRGLVLTLTGGVVVKIDSEPMAESSLKGETSPRIPLFMRFSANRWNFRKKNLIFIYPQTP